MLKIFLSLKVFVEMCLDIPCTNCHPLQDAVANRGQHWQLEDKSCLRGYKEVSGHPRYCFIPGVVVLNW